MSFYVSAEALLADARLRLEAFGGTRGLVVVEGNDDLRIFYRRVQDPALVMPTGGRTLLLSALTNANEADRDRIVFVTDCDYAVRRGDLSGGHGLAITSGTDVESDLLDLGLLAPVVAEVVPSAVSSRSVRKIANDILRLARVLALPVGRMRMAVQPLGVDLRFDELDFSRYWLQQKDEFDATKLLKVISDKLRAAAVDVNLPSILGNVPNDDKMCHGKDLLSAIRTILIRNYSVDKKLTVEHYASMLRLAMDSDVFEDWTVVRRLRKWESTTSRSVLLPRQRLGSG
jgi:hypothetical protein